VTLSLLFLNTASHTTANLDMWANIAVMAWTISCRWVFSTQSMVRLNG
jgi:hypothetical protein